MVTTVAFGQESPYSVPLDTINSKREYIPTGVRLGADILSPIIYAFDNRKLSYELTAETDLSNFGIIVEWGYQNFTEKNDNVDYSMNGTFMRVGPTVNFLAADKQLNSFTYGLRYAWSNFNETVIGNVEVPNWGAVPVNFDIQQNTSHWLEMTTGVKVRLWKGLFTGYILRLRFARTGSKPEVPFTPYYVPGYGLADRGSTWGFQYYLMYRIQWDKKLVKVKKKG